jgi:hypothetical protein
MADQKLRELKNMKLEQELSSLKTSKESNQSLLTTILIELDTSYLKHNSLDALTETIAAAELIELSTSEV